MKFCELFKKKRMEIGTVREFAKKSGLDLAYVSRLENGITLPPKDIKKLEHLALALGIKERSAEWREFMDLAAIAKNELPEDLRDNEKIAKILPAFYRTLRSKKMSEQELQKLLNLIKDPEEESVTDSIKTNNYSENPNKTFADNPDTGLYDADSIRAAGKESVKDSGGEK